MHTGPDGHLSVPYNTHSTVMDRHLKLHMDGCNWGRLQLDLA
jgi:hypothetical protein